MSIKQKNGSKKTTAAKNYPADEVGLCVYIGPTIMGVIQNGTVIRGSKQEALTSVASAVAKYPNIATLIVPGNTLAEDRIKVKTPGNWLYVNYHKVMSGTK